MYSLLYPSTAFLRPRITCTTLPLYASKPRLNPNPTGQCLFIALGSRRRERSAYVTAAGNAATIQCDCSKEKSSLVSVDSKFSCEEELEPPEIKLRIGYEEDESNNHKMIGVCDKLIEVFMVDKPSTADWRRLLAFSREWENIRPHFYRRCEVRGNAEKDLEVKQKLFRLARKLKEVDEDVQKHNKLLEMIKDRDCDINAIVSKRRKDFTEEFFLHLHTVAESYYDNPSEQNAIAKVGNTCLAAIQSYDTASESIDALNAAELKFQDIMNSPTLDVACKKIDALAERKELDSALVLMLTKAWSAAKESNMMKDEVKDVLYHLYMTARGNLQRLVPKEIRILKHLLTLDDPKEQLSALTDAFTPGLELEGKDLDSLYTTPEKLHTWIRSVVDAYHFSREGTLIREAKDLMNPRIMRKLEELKKLVEKNFM